LSHSADDHALHLSDRHDALGLLTGMVQAYIFSILAAVYIAAATRTASPSLAGQLCKAFQMKQRNKRRYCG
jgi:hypothetical protein